MISNLYQEVLKNMKQPYMYDFMDAGFYVNKSRTIWRSIYSTSGYIAETLLHLKNL